MNDIEIKKRLDSIARQMKQPGANIEELSRQIDQLLGTALPEENRELAGKWERSHRHGK